jgi:hypothetical protein
MRRPHYGDCKSAALQPMALADGCLNCAAANGVACPHAANPEGDDESLRCGLRLDVLAAHKSSRSR